MVRLREFAALRAIENKYASAAATLAAANRAAAAVTAAAEASANEGMDAKATEAAAAAAVAAAAAAAEAEAAAEARISRGGSSGKPCKLQMRIAQVKADLICQHEKDLLLPAGGRTASCILRLLRPTLQRTKTIAANSGELSTDNSAEYNSKFRGLSSVNSLENGAATKSASAIGPTPLVSLVGVSCIITSSGIVRQPAILYIP